MSDLLNNLVAMDVEPEQLLAAGIHRDTGVLASLTSHQLRKLAPAAEEIKGLPFDILLRLSRFTVERALLVKKNADLSRLEQFDARAEKMTTTLINNHLSTQEANAQRRAKKMTDTNVVETTETAVPTTTTKKTAGAKAGATKVSAKPAAAAATKVSAKPAAATKVSAKPAVEKPAKGAAEAARVSKYAGRKITVVNKDHGCRPGTKRQLLVDAVLKSKKTDEALAKTVEYNGEAIAVTTNDIKFVVDSGWATISE